MNLQINETIDVITIYKKLGSQTYLHKIRWKGRSYVITKIGYHHKVRQGNTLYHIFHVSTASLAFRVKHNTDNLQWILENVSDGNPG
ncbi:MAG TPA: hypothetical protein VLF93_05900 [Candidatus Saccharimonadales bacterium]|nr:hypothetical protein [Candidatus Saccharimonadales bacterium]